MMGQCVTCGRPAEGDLCEYHNDPRTQWKTISDIEECFEEKITEKERLEARIARLEAEAVAQVELTTDLYDRITARDERIAELEAALRFAHAHIDELCDAWERGVISEHDGRGGLRSNRNAAVEILKASDIPASSSAKSGRLARRESH